MATRSTDQRGVDDFLAAAVAVRDPGLEAAERAKAEYLARKKGETTGPLKPYPPLRPKPKLGQTWLCIGDSHAHPDVGNHRYEWAGRMAADLGVDLVWEAGDWWDMPSLSGYDKGKKCYEGRRYWRDIDVGVQAMIRFNQALGGHKPRKVRTLGNHEHRIHKAIEADGWLDGVIGTHDLLSSEFGWEEYPFLEPVVIEGIALCHYFQSGIMGRAIGGEHPATMLIKKVFHSSLQGHSHQLDYADRIDAAGRAIQAMHVGCWFHSLYWPGKQVNAMYNRCLVVLRNVKDGTFDPEVWSMDRVRAKYGG